MKHIETDFNQIYILDQQTALVEVKQGMEVDENKSRYANELIAKEMPGHYGLILDRKQDYSFVPHDVYKIFNSMKNLKAIAIVLHGKRNFLPPDMEQQMFKGQFDLFDSVDDAHKWIQQNLD